jgi:hypothetical protein
VANRATVSAIFTVDDGIEKKFTRSIIGSSAEHRIDNEVIKPHWSKVDPSLLSHTHRANLERKKEHLVTI